MLEFSGPRLSAMRRAAGLRVEELAAKAGISVATIKVLECGLHSNPRMQTLQRLAAALDRPAMCFFADQVQETKEEAV